MKKWKLLRTALAVSAALGIVVSSTAMVPLSRADDNTGYYRTENGDRSTLSKHWSYDHIHYAALDDEGRSGKDTAYLKSKNLTNDALRQRQDVDPTGWHQADINGSWIDNRGHEIAYSLSRGINDNGHYNGKDQAGDQDNPKNLFTQTAYSNQQIQTIFESEVRESLENGEKVIYQVTPIFHGNDEMASGVHMQARSTDGNLNFNVYLYNKQPGVKIDYRTGEAEVTGVTTRRNYVNDYYHRQNSYGYGTRNYSYNYNYGNYYRNYENDSGYHRTYAHHWSPMQREHWYNTMHQRYWSRGIY